MLKVEIEGKKYNVPDCWDDVSMRDYAHAFWNLEKTNDSMDENEKEIITNKNMAKITARLIGEKDDFFMDKPIGLFSRMSEIMGFIYDIDSIMAKNEFHITINGKKYFMPDVETMQLRQYIDTDEIMKDDNNPNQFIELLAALLVCYDKDGKLTYDGKYQERMKFIETMKAADGLPFIFTFYKKKVLSKRLSEFYSGATQMKQNVLNM